MDIEKEREAFEAWFESRYNAHFMQFALDLDMYADKHTQTCWEAWQAAKAQAVPEIQQSKQAEIDDLKAQLKAAHESRIEFVEYCRMIESNDFVLMPKEPTPKMIDAADNCDINGKVTANIVYKAMIEAAQEPK